MAERPPRSAGNAPAPPTTTVTTVERVFLIHGMGRTRASMWLLGRRLRAAGYAASRFGYRVRRDDLEVIAQAFAAHVRQQMAPAVGSPLRPPTTYAIIGHSLGNLITRLASPWLPPGWCRFVMLAPPNQPPVIARWLRDNPLFRLATRDAGSKLADAHYVTGLPVPTVPSLIIAGTRGLQLPWLPFQGPNDAILQVEETRLEGVPVVHVPGVHTFLMNRGDVFAVIRDFLAGVMPPGISATGTHGIGDGNGQRPLG